MAVHPSGTRPTSSGERTMQQKRRDEADDQDRRADRQPAGATSRPVSIASEPIIGSTTRPVICPTEAIPLANDRARDEPTVDRAIDAQVERPGEVHPRHAEQQVEHRQRYGQRQRHVGEPGGQHRDAQHQPRALAVQQAAKRRRSDWRRGCRPSETAPEMAVRDQPKSVVIGETKTDSVATAPPWRERPAQQVQPRMTQP